MKYADVLIRKKTNVDLLDPRIVKAFKSVTKTTTVPIYYEMLQPRVQKLIDDPTACIGVANNIHFNEYGDIVCNVITNDVIAATSNFDEVIDNFIIELDTKTGNGILKQLVIYNKDEKKKIDEMRAERATSCPKFGAAAVPSNIPKEAVDAAINNILEEMKEEVVNE